MKLLASWHGTKDSAPKACSNAPIQAIGANSTCRMPLSFLEDYIPSRVKFNTMLPPRAREIDCRLPLLLLRADTLFQRWASSIQQCFVRGTLVFKTQVNAKRSYFEVDELVEPPCRHRRSIEPISLRNPTASRAKRPHLLCVLRCRL